jgi:hypothetical protein
VNNTHRAHLLAIAFALLTLPLLSHAQTPPPAAPITLDGTHLRLSTPHISAEWSLEANVFKTLSLSAQPQTAPAFTLALEGRKSIKSSDLKITHPPTITPIPELPNAERLVDRLPGSKVELTLEGNGVSVLWRAIVRDDAPYFREELEITATGDALPLRRVTLIDLPLRFPYPAGTADGVPIVSGNLYFGVEHPSAENEVEESRARCALARAVPLEPAQKWTVSAVVGSTRPDQLRRDFQAYLELERPRPTQPFLHYNSWYDLGYFNAYTSAQSTAVVKLFGEELSKKRGVELNSFLFDDGWDDHGTLWGFNKDFPNGFADVTAAAKSFNAAPGVWLSPWGGYGRPKDLRIESGKKAGYETNDGGFALSGPKYYERFRQVCLDMVEKYGVNQFKFDGTGNVSSQVPGSPFGTDFEAMIQLISDLRARRPDLYVNLTTGTWPSPFWTRYADSIWRGGEDHSFAGVGTSRQRWITYKDGDVFHGIVSKCPLYPLNSLMLHGIIYAQHAHNLDTDPAKDFADEVHAYFATGTQCQEMYITPTLLTPANWDALAAAAKWARANATTLRDSHWVGGDPWKGEVYGWAAWSPEKGIVTLRNPSDQPATFDLHLAQALELPNPTAPYTLATVPFPPAGPDAVGPVIPVNATNARRVDLKPFEVITLELRPVETP